MTRKKKPPTASLVCSSAAEYLTFVAASGGCGVEASNLAEEAVVQDFRITATDGKTHDTKHYNLSAMAGTGIGPRIGPGWPDSPGHRACSRKEAAA